MLPFFDEDHGILRNRVRAFAERELYSSGGDQSAVEKRALQLERELGAAGFLQYTVPRECGGIRDVIQGRDLCIVREELARGDALADSLFAMQALGGYPIALAGSESQKHKYLPGVASGKVVAAFAITEPGAGSDVASMQTRALRDGNHYSINGSKCFISNAGIADFYVAFAVTEPDHGISAFVVDSAMAGLTVTKTELLSSHPIGFLEFHNCRVGDDALLGKREQGLQVAFTTLDLLRCTVGAAAVGLAQRALEEAIRYSKARRQFGRAIAEFQSTEFKLAEMATDLEASRLLVYQAAWAHDRGLEHAKQHASMAKFYATEAAQRIVDQALQIHGGAGLIAGSIMERLYRDVRALRIYEGTTEIQKLIIARELLKA
jgi:acyl-CoA dehydrogenase